MKALLILCLLAGVCVGAHAQVTLYDGLGGSQDDGYFDTDGGILGPGGVNYGGATGQLITGVAGAGTISSIEAYYVGLDHDPSSAATALYVQVYDLTTSTLTGSETISSFSETDGSFSSGVLSGFAKYDVTAAVDIGGLLAGNQYIVSMQVQSPDEVYQGISHGSNPDTYVENFSNFGYGPIYTNISTWTETGAYGTLNGNPEFVMADTMMDIQATPEPVSMGVLGLGVVAMLRRRRHRA